MEVVNSASRMHGISAIIDRAKQSRMLLGLPMVDEYLLGVLPTDLVIIGAGSGVGKTQVLTETAKYNACMGKRVLFIALEAEDSEIEMRLLYQILASLYFAIPANVRPDTRNEVSYRAWRLGFCDEAFSGVYERAQEMFHQRYDTLSTVYRSENFTIKDFEKILESVQADKPDIVILDHLHYFDHDGMDENRAVSDIIKRIRQLNLFYQIPFVVAAHTRKDVDAIVPDKEHFMGTSNIYKQATVCVMLSPKPDGYHSQAGISDTLISVTKTRTGGMGNLCGEIYFSIPNQSYAMQWKLGRLTNRRSKFEVLSEEDKPRWARARNEEQPPEAHY